MLRFIVLLFFGLLAACSGQTPEELVEQGDRLRSEGNLRGAIVLYKNALDKDTNDLTARIGLAESYLESGDYDEAEKEFQKVLLQNPSLTDISLRIVTIYISQGNTEKALEELQRYHEKHPETPESLTIQGRAHAVAGDLQAAESQFTRALQSDQRYADAHLGLAKIYLQANDPGKAERSLRTAIEIDPSKAEATYLLASLESARGNLENALTLYLDLAQRDSRHFYALYMAGMLQIDLTDFSAAAATIETLKKNFPDRPEATRLQGVYFYRQGEFEDARVALEESLQIEQHPLSYFFLGMSYYSLERYEVALNQFQRALDIDPQFERASVLVALTLLTQQRFDDAIAQGQRIVRNNPKNAYARNILGSAYLAAGQLDRGMAELQVATDLDPTLVDAHLKRGAVHLSRGEVTAGEEDLIRAVHLAPDVLNSRLMLVTHYLRQKNYAAAIKSLEEGLDGSPQDALLGNYLAAAYFSQNKPEQALAALAAAKEADPSYLTPYFNIASYYASQSDYDRAIREYEQILKQEPENLRALLSSAALYNAQGREDELATTYRRIEATGTEQGFVASVRYQLRRQDGNEALAVVNRGLQRYGTSEALLELKAALHRQRGERADAEQAFVRLAAAAPERGNNLLLRYYLSGNEVAKAQTLVTELLRTRADQEYPYQLAATMHMASNDSTAAIAVLQQGMTRLERPATLQLQLGSIYDQTGQRAEAEKLYRAILAADPTFAPAHVALGIQAERQGNKGAARDFYQDSLRHDESNIVALNNLAYILADNFGENQLALDYAMRAYQLRSNDPRIMDTLGYVLVKNNRAQEALNLLEQAHRMLPDIPAVALHLAQARIQAGDKEAARALLEQISGDPAADEAAQAKRLLEQL
ncbi:MAG: PEP-CTERM system TPR-repeat protein PrsT [Pelovirga sp.]